MKIRLFKYRFLGFLTFILVSFLSFGQSKADIESKIQQLEKDIETAEALLKETSKSKNVTVQEITLLQAQIKQREELIKTYKKQVNVINKEINDNKKDIENLQIELNNHREEYANLLVISYKKNNNLDNLLFIFSSEDFSQAIRRLRYIKQFQDILKERMSEIEDSKSLIKNKLDKNESEKKSKQKLLDAQKKEYDALVIDKKKLDEKINKLKSKEASIKKDIQAKNKETEELQKKIKKIISEEARKAREREAIARSANKTSIDYQLSTNFENNKGKLPWPCEGIVTGNYGKTQHPTQTKVILSNHGIDITTSDGSIAYCVFDGEVATIFNTGKSNVVMVRHGLYFTLYANLEKVFVKNGDKIKTGDKIGTIHTNSTDNTTVLHFEVWNDKNHTNPKSWLKP